MSPFGMFGGGFGGYGMPMMSNYGRSFGGMFAPQQMMRAPMRQPMVPSFVRAPMTTGMFGSNGQMNYGQPPVAVKPGAAGNFQRPPMTADMFADEGQNYVKPGTPAIGSPASAFQIGQKPFMPTENVMQRTGGEMVQPELRGTVQGLGGYMPAQPAADPLAAWREQVASQDRARQYMPQEKAATTSPNNSREPPPPMPTGPMQQGQLGWQWGPDMFGSRDTPFGWRPQFAPGFNDYIVQMARGGRPGFDPNAVDRNDIVNSLGRLSGNPYNPATQSSFNTLLWSR